MPVKPLASIALGLALAGAGAGCRAAADDPPRFENPRLGLMTTLPIYWPEAADVGELLQRGEQPGQIRQTLETRFAIEPIDTLEAEVLRGYDRLILAQPRALSPAENVALDGWVRQGGRLLLFADPMLTRHSQFGIGDKRRAQDVILLSPILTHWGLELTFDPDQPPAQREIDGPTAAVPVALAGSFGLLPGSGCTLSGQGVLAQCMIGRGTVTILADAAVLDEPESDDSDLRRNALLSLIDFAFN